MMAIRNIRVGYWIATILVALLPLTASAAKLGKLTLLSALGQPLRAEIEVVAPEDEHPSLSAQLVFLDSLSGERGEKTLSSSGVQLALDKRANGQPFLRVTSDKPVKEQFVDMFIEVKWASGKRVYEYSFLLDASDTTRQPAVAPVVPEVKAEAPPTPAKAAEATAGGSPTPVSAPSPGTIAPRQYNPAAETKPASRDSNTSATRRVEKGDTLGKIAQETKAEGVSLVQMLVALLNSNHHAFIGGNMNRLRAGELLAIPDREAAEAIDKKEARNIFSTQAVEFDAYRKKLADRVAAGPAREEVVSDQTSTGKIAPRAAEKPAPSLAPKDKLEVSRTEARKGSASGDKPAAEDRVASEKSAKELGERIQMLEKNLADITKLVVLKGSLGSENRQAVSAPATSADAVVAKPPRKPAVPPPPPPSPPALGFLEGNIGGMVAGGVVLLLLLGYLVRRRVP